MINSELETTVLISCLHYVRDYSNIFTISDVIPYFNEKYYRKVAYTTIKTVIDRLTDKKILKRFNRGQKTIKQHGSGVLYSINDVQEYKEKLMRTIVAYRTIVNHEHMLILRGDDLVNKGIDNIILDVI